MSREPIELQVIQNLQEALQSISRASGYHYTVESTAVKLDPNQAVDALVAPEGPRPFVLLEVLPETWEYREMPDGVQLVLPVTIHWVSQSTPTDDVSRLQTYFRGCADVERAIVPDEQRGGLAQETRIVKRTPDFPGDGAQVWAQVEIEILVRRTYGEPDV